MSNGIVIVPRGSESTCSDVDTPGSVYFCQAEGGGLIKIGWATKPHLRIQQMQMHCPVRLGLLLDVPGDGRMERSLHLRFADKRHHGEWFEPIPELLALIEAWRKEPPPAPKWTKPPLERYEPKKRKQSA